MLGAPPPQVWCPGQGQASHIQLAVSSARVGSPSSGCLHPGRGQSSPFRLERTGPLTAVQVPRPGPGLLPSDPGLVGLWPLSRAWPSRCWQRKREPSGGLAGSQDPVCLEQGLEPGGHFSLQGLTAQPSRREHVNTSRAGQRAGREEDTRRPQLLSPVAAPDSSEVAASSYLSWACGQALPSLDRIRAARAGRGTS